MKKENMITEKCPDCDSLFTYSIKSKNKGFCKICSDKLSLGERILYNILDDIGIDFEHEASFEWSNKKRYDFYIESLNMIIEVHGSQHYFGKGFKRTLKEEKINDKNKVCMAIQNNIKYYIVINASISNEEFIVDNIMSSKLRTLLKIKNDVVNNLKSSRNKISLKIWDLWNQGYNITRIARAVKKNRNYVRTRLKTGNRIGKVSYSHKNPKERSKKRVLRLNLRGELVEKFEAVSETPKEVSITMYPYDCIHLDKTYFNIWVYEDEYTHNTSLFNKTLEKHYQKNGVFLVNNSGEILESYFSPSHVIREKRETHSIYGKIKNSIVSKNNTMWVFFRDIEYIKQNGFPKKINGNSKKVLQLNLQGEILNEYSSAKEAYESVTGKKGTGGVIRKCCNNIRKTHLGYRWKYKDS